MDNLNSNINYNEKDIENLNNNNNEKLENERNERNYKNYNNHKRKYRKKESILSKKPRTSQNSKSHSKSRSNSKNRIKNYTKRTQLIQDRIKNLNINLTKKTINDELEEKIRKENDKITQVILTDSENESKEKNTKQNNIVIKSIKNEDNDMDTKNSNNLSIKNIFTDLKYIKKIPLKHNESTSRKRPRLFKKYQTSTTFYKNRSPENKTYNRENYKYNFNTFNIEKEMENYQKESTNTNNDLEIKGFKTGFIYKNKKIIEKLDIKDIKNSSPLKINSTVYEKVESKRNNYKKKINLIPKSNGKNKKSDLDFDRGSSGNKQSNTNRENYNIYVPKKIQQLSRGGSQQNIHNLKQNNIPNSNVILKNRTKSYKTINNYINKDNNKINININNNIKIIAYNKKKSSWKMDNDDIIIEQDDNKLDDEKFDLFKDNISDISSIESKSNIESETTENNNKLNVYLNNIYITKSILHPKLNKKKETIINSGESSLKNSSPTQKTNNESNSNNNNNKNRYESVPHFIFKKRITNEKDSNSKTNENKKTYVKSDLINEKNYKNNIKNIKIRNNYDENEPKFEELVILQEKLKSIINGINKNSLIISNLCFDFLNYFHESSFVETVEKLFDNKNLKIINVSLKYLVLSIIVLYNYNTESIIEENDTFLFQEIFSFDYQNILHLYEYIISKVKSKNPWSFAIKNIIHVYRRAKKKVYSSNTNLNYQSVFDKIKNNTKFIRQIMNRIFSNSVKVNDKLVSFSKDIERRQFGELKNFFNKNIFIQNKSYGYIYPFYLYKDFKKQFVQEKMSYIEESTNKYTLVIGLEDILINLTLDKNKSESKGILKFRPGLISFLKEMSNFFEIFVFSLSEDKIADYIMDSIEKRNKFFDYRLYRENLKINNDEFVIDLDVIDRSLDETIIISNIPQIYQLYKDNSINIKSYWEEDFTDNILRNLSPMLRQIAKEGGDVRELLLKYRDDIIKIATIGSFEY